MSAHTTASVFDASDGGTEALNVIVE
jgi:hypothetical protein